MNAPSIESMLVVPPGHSDTNLFIRSIPEFVTDDQLEEALSVFGPLESKKVMRDIHTGRSMEKAFARFSDAEAAREAMRSILEDGLFDARPRVEWARQQYDETISAMERKQKKKLFMRNIPGDVSEDDVRALAEQYGEVESVTLRRDTQPSRTGARGVSVLISDLLIAFILYAHEGCAAEACEKIYRTFPFESCGSTPILTKLAETKKERSGRRGPFENQAHRPGMMGRKQGRMLPTVCSGESSSAEQMYYSSASDRGVEDCGTKESMTPLSECSENSMMNSGDRSGLEGMSPSGSSLSGNMSFPQSSGGGYATSMRGWNPSMQPNHREHQNYSFGAGSGGYEEGGSESVVCPPSRHPLCPPMNPPPCQQYPSHPSDFSPYKQQLLPSGASPQPFNRSMDSRQCFPRGGQYPPSTGPQRFPPNIQTPSSPPSRGYSSPSNAMHQDCTTPMMTMGSAEACEYSPYNSSSSSSRMQHQPSHWPVNPAHQRPSYSEPEKQFPQQSKDVETTMCDSVTSTSAMSVKSSSAWSTDSKRSDTYRHNPYSFD